MNAPNCLHLIPVQSYSICKVWKVPLVWVLIWAHHRGARNDIRVIKPDIRPKVDSFLDIYLACRLF